MQAVRDLVGGSKPQPIELIYNGSLAVDCVTQRYSGSVAKFMDHDDIDHGTFATFGGLATIGERVCGILEEGQGTTGNYLLNDGTYAGTYRKITPCFPSTVVEAEYAQSDRAGTSNLDTNFTGSASGTTLTCGDSITTADVMIGGWVYITNGSCADYLYYVTDSDASGALTVSALAAAVAATDDLVVILPPMVNKCLFYATYTGIKSDVDDNTWSHPIQGLSTWIQAPGIPKQKLNFEKHNGLKISNARFYHQFTFAGHIDENSATKPNAWCGINSAA